MADKELGQQGGDMLEDKVRKLMDQLLCFVMEGAGG
jgi:hypothetical protein